MKMSNARTSKNTRILRQILTGCLTLLLSIGTPSSADGKTAAYKQGLQHYAKGEFDKSIQSLQNALTKKPSKSEKVKIYKYIGLSLFTLGRQSEAEKNFQQCIATDPNCSIEAKEALDESVLPFFQGIKRGILERKSTPRPRTMILVKTPVKDAEILLDGILLGPANTALEVDPGTRSIVLQAKGYRPRQVKIAINKLVENVYEINLEKLPAKIENRAKEKAKSARLARERTQEKEREKERSRRQDARKARDDRKDKVPPVLPGEDETVKKLADPGPEPRKQSLELAEDKGPPTPSAVPPAVPAEPVALNREPISLAHFLPLGVGQFYNGDYLLGTVFFGTQLYAVAVIVVANQDILQAQENERAAFRRAQIDSTVTPEDIDTFTAAKQSFVKEKQQRINLALGAAAGTYFFGVMHALIMRPYVLPNTVSVQLQPFEESGLQLQAKWEF